MTIEDFNGQTLSYGITSLQREELFLRTRLSTAL